jgi:hypothetical protein
LQLSVYQEHSHLPGRLNPWVPFVGKSPIVLVPRAIILFLNISLLLSFFSWLQIQPPSSRLSGIPRRT